jgi:lipopolysaccharide export system permease protein
MLHVYLLKKYLKSHLLVTFTFISILIVSRSQEIAKIAVFTKSFKMVFYFVLLHIPVILPLALCVSCFLASFFLFSSLAQTKILSALRAQGLSLKKILFPIIYFCTLLAISNFWLISELATTCWHHSKNLPFNFARQNPLSALLAKFEETNQMIVKGRCNHVDQLLQNTFLFTYVPHYKNVVCLFTGKLQIKQDEITAQNVNMISYVKGQNPHFYDHLILDYRKELQAPLSHYLQTYMPQLKTKQMDYYTLGSLFKNPQFKDQKKVRLNELYRRIMWGLCPLFMMLLGFAFGSIRRSFLPIFTITLATLFLLSSLLFANAAIHIYLATSILMTLSAFLSCTISFYYLNRYQRGIVQ